MNDSPNDKFTEVQQRWLRTPEAARHLGLSGRTMEKHRTYGTGPAYRKLGGRVVYAVADLDAWANRGKRASTSDPGTDTILPARWPDPVRPGIPAPPPEQASSPTSAPSPRKTSR